MFFTRIAPQEVVPEPVALITEAQVPSFYLPYARNALAEVVADIELALESGCEIRAGFTAQFVIDRCEYAIGRARAALEQAQRSSAA